MSRFLGLDLSFSSTGFYMIQDDGKHLSFEIDTSPHDFSGDIERADYIARYIVDRIKGVEIDLIGMEDYFCGKQPGSVIKLAILGTMVRLRLMEDGRSFMTFAPTQIKKFETGSGVAPKDTMLKSVFKKRGFDTTSNNIADACAIAYTAKGYHEWMGGRREFLEYEKEVLKKIAKERGMTRPYSISDFNCIKIKGEPKK